ncbi:MAG: hypothetical protein HGGPFJEG_00947 [Ignavibacteria bacterium]|nr:hypothetical protein [Ignavibacteria bacterium]
MENGVSVVLCCYNSSKMLPETLEHLCNQNVNPEINWEIIIVNNSSTDETVEIAEKILRQKSPVAYRIINESRPGLSFARKSGIENAVYAFIIFCDDDNHLNPDYVNVSYEIMSSRQEIGAAGGISESKSRIKLPAWFEEHKQNYSVGKQAEVSGDITNVNIALWGAGMVIRTEAAKYLYSKGFKSMLTDRKQGELSSGGDSEFCFAFRLAGYKIIYDERLNLKHFLPDFRLNWNYLRKLSRAFGAQKIYFEPYLKKLNVNSSIPFKENHWSKEAFRLLKKLRQYGLKKLLKMNKLSEGDWEQLRIEKTIGRLQEILKIRNRYNKNFILLEQAEWMKKIILK